MLMRLSQPLFHPVRLDAASAPRAWPLVRLFEPAQSLAAWVSFVRAQKRRSNSGVTAIEDQRGYFHAVIVWTVETHLSWRRTLRIAAHMVGSLPGHALQDAVIAAVRDLSREKQCDTILVDPGESHSSLARETLLATGFRPLARQAWLAPALDR
jgi:hypothetical protein